MVLLATRSCFGPWPCTHKLGLILVSKRLQCYPEVSKLSPQLLGKAGQAINHQGQTFVCPSAQLLFSFCPSRKQEKWNITDAEVMLWSHYLMEQHLLFPCEAYRKETGASLCVLTAFVISQVVQFCLGFSHQWTMWPNQSHDSTEIQRLLCMPGKQGVNRWNWKSHCVGTYMSLLKALFNVKKIGISCRFMFLVAATSK